MEIEQEMYNFNGSSFTGADIGAAPANPAHIDPDRAALLRVGKRQVLKVGGFNQSNCPLKQAYSGQRNFGFLSMTAFSCGLMSTWEAIVMLALVLHRVQKDYSQPL